MAIVGHTIKRGAVNTDGRVLAVCAAGATWNHIKQRPNAPRASIARSVTHPPAKSIRDWAALTTVDTPTVRTR